jgi:hypothetical protein
MQTNKWKQQAAEMGLEWATVRACYRELREMEVMARQLKWEARSIAWKTLAKGHGGRLKMAYRKAFTTGDMTMIPGFDSVAKELAACEIPQLGTDDPATALWDLVTANKDNLPPADETMREALERALELKVEAAECAAVADDTVPF